MRIRRAGRPIRACGKHTKGKRTSRRVFAAQCVDERVSQHGTSIARNNPIAQKTRNPTCCKRKRTNDGSGQARCAAAGSRSIRDEADCKKCIYWTLTVKFPPNLRETSQPVEIGVHVSFSLSFTCH